MLGGAQLFLEHVVGVRVQDAGSCTAARGGRGAWYTGGGWSVVSGWGVVVLVCVVGMGKSRGLVQSHSQSSHLSPALCSSCRLVWDLTMTQLSCHYIHEAERSDSPVTDGGNCKQVGKRQREKLGLACVSGIMC